VKEVNLVAQDLTAYGKDLPEKTNLAALLRELDRAGDVDWIRLLYAYPIGIDEELLDTIVALPRVCDYLDLPLQHASLEVLKAMKRPVGKFAPREIIRFIRDRAPSIHLRTTFIVGFPGETEDHVAELEEFILEGHFTSVGIFTYSPEAGTPSHDYEGHLPQKVRNARKARLMKAQQRVVRERLASFVGSTVEVLVEGTHEDTDLLLTGRTRYQAPEVDGSVIINDVSGDRADLLTPGSFFPVEITEVAGYDLLGRVALNLA
jgi:ribosomal protein S12 methylthiotransferase